MENKWKDDDINRFWKELEADPTNVQKAKAYWDACGNYFRGDIRSGLYVISTFRECALQSQDGVAALAKAYRELLNLSGEYPRRGSFDQELVTSIKEGIHLLKGEDKVDVEWILKFLE